MSYTFMMKMSQSYLGLFVVEICLIEKSLISLKSRSNVRAVVLLQNKFIVLYCIGLFSSCLLMLDQGPHTSQVQDSLTLSAPVTTHLFLKLNLNTVCKKNYKNQHKLTTIFLLQGPSSLAKLTLGQIFKTILSSVIRFGKNLTVLANFKQIFATF